MPPKSTRPHHRTFAASLIATVSLATSAWTAATAHAEDAAASESGSFDGPVVQEMVVTARHRTEDPQKVPVALSVVGGDFLEKTNTTSISQVAQLVPSIQFTYTNARNSNINIRGLGSNLGLANDGLNSGVGFYVDQVFYTRAGPSTFDLIDIDRIEVLRGPQGTLFGKDTTAGAISVNTAAPTFTPSGLAEVSAGDHGYFQAKTSVSGPIIADQLAGRLSLATTTRDGYLTNIYNGEKVNDYRNVTARGQLLFTPSEDLKIRFIGDYSNQDLNCCGQVLAGIVSPPNGKNFLAYTQHFGYTPVVDPSARDANMNSPFSARQETGGASAEVNYNLSGAVLTSVTAWRFWNWWPQNDADFSPLPIFLAGGANDYENQFTQELRIASTGDNRIDYVGGLYFYREKLRAQANTVYGEDASYFLLGPAVPSVVANGLRAQSTAKYDTESVAAFGQAVWHATSQLNLTGGLRYTVDYKKGDFAQIVSGVTPLIGTDTAFAAARAALAANGAFGLSVRQNKLSGMFNVSYQLTPDILAYSSYSRGYKSGGLNLQQLPPAANLVVEPETIDTIEAGLKTSFLDRRVTLNAAAFWERDRNYQANNFDQNVNKVYLSNVPEVRSQGVEADLQVRPTDHWSFYTSATFDDATYVKYSGAPCGLEAITRPSCSLDGRPLAGVPRWSAAAGGEYGYPLSLWSHEVRAYVGLDYNYRSSLYSQATDSIYSALPQLSLVNVRLGVRADQWDAYIWSKNVTNENYFTFIQPGTGNTGSLYGQLGDPRTIGATFRYKW
jgi:iron complex outermembrane receptor protein